METVQISAYVVLQKYSHPLNAFIFYHSRKFELFFLFIYFILDDRDLFSSKPIQKQVKK